MPLTAFLRLVGTTFRADQREEQREAQDGAKRKKRRPENLRAV
jgi:hypothetical protein